MLNTMLRPGASRSWLRPSTPSRTRVPSSAHCRIPTSSFPLALPSRPPRPAVPHVVVAKPKARHQRISASPSRRLRTAVRSTYVGRNHLPDFTFGPPASSDSPVSPPHSPLRQPSHSQDRQTQEGAGERIHWWRPDHWQHQCHQRQSWKADAERFSTHPARRPTTRSPLMPTKLFLAAISCHDLNSILQQPRDGPNQSKAGSAPTSPLDLENKPTFLPFLRGREHRPCATRAWSKREPVKTEEPEQKRPVSPSPRWLLRQGRVHSAPLHHLIRNRELHVHHQGSLRYWQLVVGY